MNVPPRLSAALLLAAGAFSSTGCHSTRVCEQGGREMCVVDNTCLQAFGFIPLVSGDVDSPDDDGMVLFRDTTTVANNVRLVERAMRGRRATGLRNLTSYRTDEQILIFLLKRTTLRSSAELVQEPLQ